ncbi:MAG: hypothetical protein GC161_13620 [Planctomycetaceae bacterium]|nr:hypothetical protein [Planctomycetaceae bacterium]
MRRTSKSGPTALRWSLGVLVCAVWAWFAADARPHAHAQQDAQEDPQPSPVSGARAELLAALEAQGVHLDPTSGVVSIAARVLVRDELLEYLLVGRGGAAHESLFGTDVSASAVHTAMLLAGFESGTNARWVPNPLGAEVGARRPSFDVLPPVSAPNGPDVHLYAAWRDGDELYFFRVDDLIADLSSGRAMRRHGWVYLGSREVPARAGQPGGFAADVLGNFISVSFFQEGTTLATAALPECLDQTIWAANPWLVPERDQPVRFLLSPKPLSSLPEALADLVPRLVDTPAEAPPETSAEVSGPDGDG